MSYIEKFGTAGGVVVHHCLYLLSDVPRKEIK
jgi:hypothetical protein